MGQLRRFDSRKGKRFFSSPKRGPALGPTQPPVQWGTRRPFLRDEAARA